VLKDKKGIDAFVSEIKSWLAPASRKGAGTMEAQPPAQQTAVNAGVTAAIDLASYAAQHDTTAAAILGAGALACGDAVSPTGVLIGTRHTDCRVRYPVPVRFEPIPHQLPGGHDRQCAQFIVDTGPRRYAFLKLHHVRAEPKCRVRPAGRRSCHSTNMVTKNRDAGVPLFVV
jgi:hypothetical protein